MGDDYGKKAEGGDDAAEDTSGDYAGTKSTDVDGEFDNSGDPGKAGENNTSTGANQGNAGGDGSTSTGGAGNDVAGSSNEHVEGGDNA